MTNKIDIGAVVYDPSIYPRSKPSTRVTDEYVDVIKSGKPFDKPIVLEEGTNKLLDGKHRTDAYKKYAEKYEEAKDEKDFKQDEWAEPISEIPVEYHKIPDGIPAYIYALSLSAKHGYKVEASDKKANARKAIEENPDFSVKMLSEYIGVSTKTMSGYVEDLLARRKEEQKYIAYRLYCLGWTQEEIGQAIGMQKAGVYKRYFGFQNGSSEEFPIGKQNSLDPNSEFGKLEQSVKSLLESGIPHLEVAERFKMPLILTHAIDLQPRTDIQRMERLDIKIQPYDVWNFTKCDDRFGNQHPGRIPGQLIAHVLYFFTEQGDMIIDPMSGSGTTQDACLAMGRKCYAFDIDQRHGRNDVITHNIATDGWHDRTKKADLIFWDPPYFEKMDKSNIGDEGYIEGSISGFTRESYLEFFANSFSSAKKLVKKGAKIAFLMSDWDDDTNKRDGVFIWDYANMLQKSGWKLLRQIQIPLSTQQVHPDIVIKFRKSKRLARLERYLLIGEAL